MKTNQNYRLGRCYVLAQEYAIQFEQCDKQSLQPKFIEVLNYLALNYPRIIPREELIEHIWQGNAYVGEKALTNAIWHLRQNLSQENNDGEIIETIRKVGYRLLVEPEFDTLAIDELPAGHKHVLNNMQRTWKDFVPHYLIVLVIVLTFGFFQQNKQNAQPVNIEKITKAPGSELFAAPSPDGRYLVYRWEKTDGTHNLHMQDTHQPQLKAKQLTFNDAEERLSVWDNSGTYLYFARKDDKSCQIIKLNVTTGQEDTIAKCPRGSRYYYLDISPDNQTLAMLGRSANTDDVGIYFLALDQKNAVPKRFSCSNQCSYRERDMAFSPSGEYIAVSRRFNRFNENIYLVNLNTNETIQLTRDEEDIVGLTWHPNGKYLVYGTRRAGIRNGYIIDIDSKETTNLAIDGFSYPKFAKQSGQLYYQQRKEQYFIASLHLKNPLAASAFPIVQSEYNHQSPDFSPVNNKMVYVSNESGFYELWQANIDGTEREQLTHLKQTIRYPKWSHNGEKVAFLAPSEQRSGDHLYVFNIKNKKLSIIESQFTKHNRPSWSLDDKSLISAVYSEDYTDLFMFELSSNKTTRLTNNSARYGVMISPTEILYSKPSRGLWQKNIADNTPAQLVVSHEIFDDLYTWSFQQHGDTQGVYFRTDQPRHAQLSYYDFGTKAVTPIAHLPPRTFESFGSLLLSAKGDQLLFTSALYPQSDIKRLSHPLLH